MERKLNKEMKKKMNNNGWMSKTMCNDDTYLLFVLNLYKYFLTFNKFIIQLMKIDEMHNFLTDHYKNRRKSKRVK